MHIPTFLSSQTWKPRAGKFKILFMIWILLLCSGNFKILFVVFYPFWIYYTLSSEYPIYGNLQQNFLLFPCLMPHVCKKYFWHWKTLLFWSKGSMELLTNLIVVTIFFIEKKSFYPPGASNQSVLFSLLRTTFFLEFKLCQGLSIFRRMRFEPKKIIAKKHIQAKLMLIFLLRETCY